MQQNVSATVDQGLRRLRLFRWVKPRVHPDHTGLDFWVDRLRAQSKGVDVAQHFRNRERANET